MHRLGTWIYFIVVYTIVVSVFIACTDEKNTEPTLIQSKNPKVDNLKLPDGFAADHLFGPSENGEGSWVSMTFDDKGRIIASDQYGYLYRLTVPPIGDTTPTKIEKLDIHSEKKSGNKKVTMGYAHGLLYAFNSLYVMVNHGIDTVFDKGSGLYRLQDTNGDDQYDKVTLLKALKGEGEHGPHSIVLSPDKKSLFVIAGNFTEIPKMDSYRNKPEGKLDNLFPLVKDPNGHDNTVYSEGGWIAQVDSTGKNWELYSSGFRNPFDLAFNEWGDMFTYDSDMEWDLGTPWYRPTRVCHVTSGSEFGWRPGTLKWSPDYADNLPAAINVGQGSPTNFIYAGNAKFPDKYRNAFLAFDWSFGIIYAIHAVPDGASYKTTGEEFISGSPLPLTDGVIGPDGALYFLTGGRRLESDLYRVYYKDFKQTNSANSAPKATEGLSTRRKLESFHTSPLPGAVDFAWPYLKSPDRFIQYAARIAIEHQPTEIWQTKLFAEKDPATLIQATIAWARKGNPSAKNQVIQTLLGIDFSSLSEMDQLNWLRACELIIARQGLPDATTKTSLINYLDSSFPAKTNRLNRELSKMLVYLDAPQAVPKTLALLAVAKDEEPSQKNISESADLILRNPQYGMDIANVISKHPPLQQTWYANVLSQAKTGWTDSLKNQYFKWFYTAFSFKGGVSFAGFIDHMRKKALSNLPKDQFKFYNQLSGDSIVNIAGTDLATSADQPKGPGRDWQVPEAMAVVDSGLFNRNFERGRSLFAASFCQSCHQMNGVGGIAGPDLSQLGTRFSTKDILEAIIEPSKTISDQYGATIFYLKEGGSVLGRLIRQDDKAYYISQNPFSPLTIREIAKANVLRTRISEISPMLPGMINRLNSEELKDLMAFLQSRGNKNHEVYASKKSK